MSDFQINVSMKIFITIVSFCFTVNFTVNAQAVGSEPSLEEAISFIKSKIKYAGFKFEQRDTEICDNSTSKKEATYSFNRSDGCVVVFQQTMKTVHDCYFNPVVRGQLGTLTTIKVNSIAKIYIDLKDINFNSIKVQDMMLKKSKNADFSTVYFSKDIALMSILVETGDGKRSIKVKVSGDRIDKEFDNEGKQSTIDDEYYINSLIIPIEDEELGNRIAKALNHAVKLCGGKAEKF